METRNKTVMENREWFFANVENSKERINETFKSLENSIKMIQIIKENQRQLNENGKFTYECDEERTIDVPLQKSCQYCSNCGCLCCQICAWPAEEELSKCTYFNCGRGCPICPGKCRREAHIRVDTKKEKYTVKVTKVYEVKKNLFEESRKRLSATEVALDQEISKMSQLGKSILNDMEQIKVSLIELDKIALKTIKLTNEEYFKQLITFEEEEKKPGYLFRVKGLKMLQDYAKRINAFSKEEDITNLYPICDEILKELKDKVQNEQGNSCFIF